MAKSTLPPWANALVEREPPQRKPTPVASHEEIAAELELLVHVVEAMDDQADGRAQALAGRKLVEQLLLGARPELGNVGQLFAIDDDQQVIIREIAPDRVLDPVAARVAAKQDDLEQLAAAQPRHSAAGNREGKAVPEALDHERQLAPLGIGQMIKIAVHPTGDFALKSPKDKVHPFLSQLTQANSWQASSRHVRSANIPARCARQHDRSGILALIRGCFGNPACRF